MAIGIAGTIVSNPIKPPVVKGNPGNIPFNLVGISILATKFNSTNAHTQVVEGMNFTLAGGTAPSVAGTAAADSVQPGTILGKYTSSAIAGNSAGVFSSTGYQNLQAIGNIRWTRVKLFQITTIRLWLMLSGNGHPASAGDLLSDLPNYGYVGFRYSTAAGDSTYKCICAVSNVAFTVVDSTVPADSNPHDFIITKSGSSYQFYIDGNLVATISSNIPTVAGGGTTGTTEAAMIDNVGLANAVAFEFGQRYVFAVGA